MLEESKIYPKLLNAILLQKNEGLEPIDESQFLIDDNDDWQEPPQEEIKLRSLDRFMIH